MNKDEFMRYSAEIANGDGTTDTISYANAQEAGENVMHVLQDGVFQTDAGWVAINPGCEIEVAAELFQLLCDMMGWEMPQPTEDNNDD